MWQPEVIESQTAEVLHDSQQFNRCSPAHNDMEIVRVKFYHTKSRIKNQQW